MPAKKIPIRERLDRFSQLNEETGCIEFTGTTPGPGYGMMKVDGRPKGAHRVAWELANGPVPPGKQILHRCDNPPCVNPNHLFVGTHADNMRDKVSKGRQRGAARGEANHNAKISDVDVDAIRASSVLQKDVAAEYGISQSMVSRIRCGNRR
jgi:hypothetical protein